MVPFPNLLGPMASHMLALTRDPINYRPTTSDHGRYATPACFQTRPDSLGTSPSASEAWNFDRSAFNVNSYPLWDQHLGDESWMKIPDGQGSVPLLTSGTFFPPALPELHFDFSLASAQPQLDPTPPTIPGVGTTSTPAQRITCSFAGCGRSFVRAGDCRRHMLKHGPPKFKCAVIECDMTFHRADKLRAHMKQGHKIRL
ncbi:hypothetical protein HBI81_211080 [Parastagonospora nodorum]|nr:hypothetical protein HBI09_171390 [Parastagonospora nodorum]KAH4052336.1 hypothetical protein HBH49_099960 [Parastagonospora nodorum]KAH4228831.1 hypothetical protein HBI05_198240 [Parastagonospora nodorum]KAH4801417.1 hypothetical protein HBH61_195520 [Parastagonospora nodorum]KAH4845234.1 hypothetical protein HBH59_209910 [Parastagonospora nodorum]